MVVVCSDTVYVPNPSGSRSDPAKGVSSLTDLGESMPNLYVTSPGTAAAAETVIYLTPGPGTSRIAIAVNFP
jgi:hypothetical protein